MSGKPTGLSSSFSSSRLGITRNRECITAAPYTPDGENTTRGTPSSAARSCIHPQKKSESTATTRSGVSARARAHDASGARSPANATTSLPQSEGGNPLALSTPAGMAGWEGNGRMSAEMAPPPPPPGCTAAAVARMSGAMAGVVTTVRRRPPRDARRRTRSSIGMRWPCAGNGMTRTCAAALPLVAGAIAVDGCGGAESG
uniref:Uncharacterized protein n=1 Tax=Oryza rufipogon TaxID=4529 RepID=A0A0E0PWF1_ORYRU